MAKHNQIGSWGEKIAVEYLISKGYAIRETNWRMHHYEIDIIAMIGDRLVFVEVKTRSSHIDDPALAVDRKKMNRMVRAANQYVISNNLPHEVQYDIFTVAGTPDNYEIEHIADAFLPPLHTYR